MCSSEESWRTPTVGLGNMSNKSALVVEVEAVKTFSKGFASDGARSEMSTRQGDMAIVTNVLLEHFTATFPMLTPTEMTMVVTQCQGQGFDLRCQSTQHTKLGNGLFHNVDESGELGRFGLGNRNHWSSLGSPRELGKT